jgi:hypothetical protein
LKTSYKIASDVVVGIHRAQATGFCDHINGNCGKVVDSLTDHKILKGELVVNFARNVENDVIFYERKFKRAYI